MIQRDGWEHVCSGDIAKIALYLWKDERTSQESYSSTSVEVEGCVGHEREVDIGGEAVGITIASCGTAFQGKDGQGRDSLVKVGRSKTELRGPRQYRMSAGWVTFVVADTRTIADATAIAVLEAGFSPYEGRVGAL